MTTKLSKRYEGFLYTSFLWKSDSVFGLKQFEIESSSSKIHITTDPTLRLGKYIERFVSFELKQQTKVKIIAENIQILKDKITLGELDFLLLKKHTPIHLEVIYKFYLYDDTVGASEIEHFIGPNRKDSLIEKLNKLKEKQLPLLYSKECQPYLENLGLQATSMLQQVYFNAQLFMPYSNQNMALKTLNNACVEGFYINHKQLLAFKACKFYLPDKKDWLLIPHTNVTWLNFDSFRSITKDYLKNTYSPLCWLKFKNGDIKKMFLVWWQTKNI
ncbi:DUF1853 family protein [Seonamhaeicola aphaedonensis]|uniref:DUF1853 family protein n=1 Tax=Seonamhaeicola aphaedonensis TaxID=1461338 RepID=A0A3D9H6G6_9FLAO|nr:DUF1853 family protein [Seonamhaeicola aphaedonensis]RED44741.1 hypothetical protein DFQ02_11044 [Seonamhaeicola aphaedonensis]